MAKVGRPVKMTPAMQKRIIDGISAGETLSSICQEPGMLKTVAVYRFLGNPANLEFRNSYAHARKLQADSLVDSMVDISRTPAMGEIVEEFEGEEGKSYTKTRRADMTEHRKLQVDTIKWVAARLNSMKYSEKHIVAGDPDNPMHNRNVNATSEPLPVDQIMELIKKSNDQV